MANRISDGLPDRSASTRQASRAPANRIQRRPRPISQGYRRRRGVGQQPGELRLLKNEPSSLRVHHVSPLGYVVLTRPTAHADFAAALEDI